MPRSYASRTAVAVLLLVASAISLEVTSDNWERETVNRTVFLKFYAPWCGHCKKLKPDWDRLTSDFSQSPAALIAEVDCAGKGKVFCEEHSVSSYPTLMWGKGRLRVYSGPRTYEEMKAFAAQNLGESCGPGTLVLCKAEKRELLERFKRLPPEMLDAKVDLAEKMLKRADQLFKVAERNLTLMIRMAELEKEKEIEEVNARKGLPRKNSNDASLLTAESWPERVRGRSLFLKFFAPWCGHCKAVKPAWDKLTNEFAGTATTLVAEVDCEGSGQALCEEHKVTGYPRLLWGKADSLSLYSGRRGFEELKQFAEMHLGRPCAPDNLEVCEQTHRETMEKYANMSPEKREAKLKAAEQAVKTAEKIYFDLQWNLTGQIDIAEMKKDEQVLNVTKQGLAEAKEVQAWNRLQPEGFWKRAEVPQEDGWLEILEITLLEVAGIEVTVFGLLIGLAVLLLLSWLRPRAPAKRRVVARHIVTETEEESETLKGRLDAGEDFGEIAKLSKCPSGEHGGALGILEEDSIAPALNRVCFDSQIQVGVLLGPIQTHAGFHLLIIDERHGFACQSEDKKDR